MKKKNSRHHSKEVWSPIYLANPINKLASNGMTYEEHGQRALVASGKDDISREIYQAFLSIERHLNHQKRQSFSSRQKNGKKLKYTDGNVPYIEHQVQKLEDVAKDVTIARTYYFDFALTLVKENLQYLAKKNLMTEQARLLLKPITVAFGIKGFGLAP